MPATDRFQEALRRIGSNQGLFVSMANGFVQSVGPMIDDLRRDLGKGDVTAAARLLHTLKGLAGTVGLMELGERAGRAERILMENQDAGAVLDKIDDLARLSQINCKALLAFAASLAPVESIKQTPPVRMDSVGINKVLDEMERLLNEKNMRAAIIFGELKASFGQLLGEDLIPLEQALDQLDFQLACEKVRTLRQEIL